MKKYPIFFILCLLATFSATTFAQSNRDLSGSYWVQGTNPGGTGTYKGIATIVKSGEVYRIHWEVGTTYDGIGKFQDNTFQVEWGTSKENVGSVTYKLQADGSLKGTWFVAKNPGVLGTETLTPKK